MNKQTAANTSVLILAGGKGKRLRSAFSSLPKSLAPINTEPFLSLLINYITSYGFVDFILCTGYKSSDIERAISSWPVTSNIDIKISEERQPLGTAGAIKHAEPNINSDNFIVINGDTFINIDYNKFLHFYLRNNAKALLTITPAADHQSSGSVIIDNKSRITSFCEKENLLQPSAYINAGVYMFNKSILGSIQPNQATSLEYSILPQLLKTIKQHIYGFIWAGDFIDIGVPNNYFKSQRLLKKYQSQCQLENS